MGCMGSSVVLLIAPHCSVSPVENQSKEQYPISPSFSVSWIRCSPQQIPMSFLCRHIIAWDVQCVPFHARLICIPIATSQQATVLTRSIISCTIQAASTSVWADWPSVCVHEGNKKEDWAKGRTKKKTHRMWCNDLCIWFVQIVIAHRFLWTFYFVLCCKSREMCVKDVWCATLMLPTHAYCPLLCLWGSKKDTGLGLCGLHTI